MLAFRTVTYCTENEETPSKTANTFYTWGQNTTLGDAVVGFTSRPYATAMANPLPAGVEVIQIGVSSQTYFVLGSNGRIYTVGFNGDGVAGQNNQTSLYSWATVKNTAGTAPLENVQFISTQNGTSGWGSVSAILKDGSLLAWGKNDSGMIGVTGSAAYLPKAALGTVSTVQIYAVENGGHYSLALNYGCDGTINATGHNPGGAFGDGTTGNRTAYAENLFLGNIASACTAPGGTSVLGLPSADDDRSLLVTDVSVNEASPYAVFTVSGGEGLMVGSLSFTDGSANGNGTDFGAASSVNTLGATNLEYSLDNGTTWTIWTASSAAFKVPLSGAFLVRTPVTNDTSNEGPQTFTLAATTTSGKTSMGTGTIYDDGTGTIFTAAGAVNAAATKNDDRPITIADIAVNEGSPKAVFTISGAAGQKINTLTLAAGTATSGTDYGTALEYSVNNGGSWSTFTPGTTVITLDANGKALVRNAITNDSLVDNGETYTLTATVQGGSSANGTATIKDDGTGDIFTNTGAVDANAVRDGDYALSVNNLVVNEGTPYAVWTVKYVAGQSVNLGLVYDSTAVAADLNASAAPTLQYYNTTTSAWVNYTPGSGVAVTIPTGGKLLVRTTVENDTPYEVSEVLSLKVTKSLAGTVSDIPGTPLLDVNLVSGASALDTSVNLVRNGTFSAYTGSATSMNGTSGLYWGPNSSGRGVDITDWTETGGGINTYARLNSFGGVYFGNQSGWDAQLVNSTGQYVVPSGVPAGNKNLSIFNSSSVYTGTLYFSASYTGFGDNSNPVKITQEVHTTPGTVYRLQFTQLSEYSNSYNGVAAIEIGGQRVYFNVISATDTTYTFEYTAAAASTPISFMSWGHVSVTDELVLNNVIVNEVPAAVGTLTILDNGQGDLFSSANVTGTADAPGTATSGGTLTLNDDRGNNPVVNDVTVNEGSPYAVFTVEGLPGAKVDLTMSTAGGTGTADLSADLSGWEWSNDGGQTWSSNLSGAPLNATTGQMLVRFVPTNDATLEISEAFTLKAQYSATQTVAGVNSNTATNFDTGIGTIKDDGTGQWFTGSSATGSNILGLPNADDDRPSFSINDVTVDEATGTMTFTVTKTGATTVTSTVNYATARSLARPVLA